MDYSYWFSRWQNENDFVVEKDRLKKKSYVFSSFPVANKFGFQDGKIRGLVAGDILARYQRLCEQNVLFPTGFNSLSYTSFIENKNYSNLINDDISLVFYKQMLKLGIGVNLEKHMDMRHSQYLSNLQEAFIDLYSHNYLQYKTIKVFYDKDKNKIYDYFNVPKKLPMANHECFCLDVAKLIPDILQQIHTIDCAEEIKQQLINYFQPKRMLKLNLAISNGFSLPVMLDEPEYLGGVSFLFLNPDLIDINNYVAVDEFSAIEQYLLDTSDNKLFAFSGLFAKNPLTGADIPIFISTLFAEPYYLGIPGIDSDDRALAESAGLDIIRILEHDILVNSDFLNDLGINEAKEAIFNSFIEAEVAEEYFEYKNTLINFSSLDNFGPLFPFLEDKDTNQIFSLYGHLPYAFSSKLRPVLADSVDLIGSTMSGTINNLFTEGICPIIAMLYDNIGSVNSIFSQEAVSEYRNWHGIDCLLINNNELVSSVLIPIVFYSIIKDVTKEKLPKLINKVIITQNILDVTRNEILKSNNNLLNFDKLLDDYSPDTIRFFVVRTNLEEDFVFDYYALSDLDHKIKQLEKYFFNVEETADAKYDYLIFELAKNCKKALNCKDFVLYSNLIESFIDDLFIHTLSNKQLLNLLIIMYPLLPFLTEEIYKEKLNGKYSLVNEAWPN